MNKFYFNAIRLRGKMADAELEALRKKRLNELQKAQGGAGGPSGASSYGGGGYGVRTHKTIKKKKFN